VGVFVEGRGDMGRTPAYTRTDLLISHDVPLSGNKHMKVEYNVLNLFNQKTTRYIYNGLNRGLGAGQQRTSAAIDMRTVDLTKGYDYNALILATSEGKGAYDPRYGKPALFEDGFRSYVTLKFEF